MPPGNLKWLLPPADMKMVFQGKSPKQLAAQLIDCTKNGNKSLEKLIEHVTHDDLVLASWRPAEGLNNPPVSHAEFAKILQNGFGKVRRYRIEKFRIFY